MRGVPPPENATTAVFQLIAGPGANLTLFRLTTGLRPYRPAAFAPTQQLSHTWLGQCQPSIRPGASHVSLLRQNTPPLTPDRRPGLHLTPAVAGFSAARDSKAARLLAPSFNMMARPARSWLCASYPDATSTAAITRLSYTAISTGCPIEYQRFQVSPPRPDALRTPSAAHEQGLRSTVSSSPQPGFSPVRNKQGWSCHHEARFRVAQPRPFGRPVDWVEPGDFTPERPTFAVPARLGAHGFGSGSPTVGDCRASPVLAALGFSSRIRSQWNRNTWQINGLKSVYRLYLTLRRFMRGSAFARYYSHPPISAGSQVLRNLDRGR